MAEQSPFPRQGPNPHARAPGARMSRIDEGMISRAAGFVRRMVGLGAEAERQRQVEVEGVRLEPTLPMPAIHRGAPQGAEAERPTAPSEVVRAPSTPANSQDGFFGPGQPMLPVAPHEQVAGRRFDYPVGYNLNSTPRRFEGVTFELLRSLATYDVLRLAIETRKDQLARVKWHVLPKKPPGQRHNTKADDRCRTLEAFLKKPDGVLNWTEWVRMLAEDILVLDGVALYRRKRLNGQPYGLEVMAPETISLLIDRTGRRPLPPNPAYQQLVKGQPAAEFTSDELTYSMRNPRSNKVYGHSPVEQIITYVNIGLRRMAGQLNHYTEGNIPEAVMSTPEGWTPDQIALLEMQWNAIMENPAMRRRMKFVPGGTQYWPLHGEGGAQLMDQFDEWLARIVAYAFSLPPTPFVRMMNRATAESAYETALEEGLEPMLDWLKALIDQELADFCGAPGYELVWDDIRKLDPTEKHSMDHADMQRGVKSLDEVRTERGDEPVGLSEPIFWGVGPLGFMSLSSVKRVIAQGLDMPQQPMPIDGMGLPPGADPLAGADPDVMQQLGIDPSQQGGQGAARLALPGPGNGTPLGGAEQGGGRPGQGSGELVAPFGFSPPVNSNEPGVNPIGAGVNSIGPGVNLAALLRGMPGTPEVTATLRRFEQSLRGGER